jgi:hypothetical protein
MYREGKAVESLQSLQLRSKGRNDMEMEMTKEAVNQNKKVC